MYYLVYYTLWSCLAPKGLEWLLRCRRHHLTQMHRHPPCFRVQLVLQLFLVYLTIHFIFLILSILLVSISIPTECCWLLLSHGHTSAGGFYPARLQLRLLPRPLSDEAVALLASLLLQILKMNSLAFVVILLSITHLRHVIGRELRKGGVHWLMHFPAKFKYKFCQNTSLFSLSSLWKMWKIN